jgi:hypothetical protein
MKQAHRTYLRNVGLVFFAVGFSISAWLYLTRSNPVLLTISADDTIRPRSYCLLNPFRNKEPERIAENYLSKLRAGVITEVAPFIGSNQYILEEEKKWPIQSWRIGDRQDTDKKTEILYWVQRGNGYSKDGMEEEVRFFMKESNRNWRVTHYSAIY